jgi:hypothetical protein
MWKEQDVTSGGNEEGVAQVGVKEGAYDGRVAYPVVFCLAVVPGHVVSCSFSHALIVSSCG